MRASAAGPAADPAGQHDQPHRRHQEAEEQHAARGVREQRGAQPDEQERDGADDRQAPRAGRAPGSPSHDGLGNSSSARM